MPDPGMNLSHLFVMVRSEPRRRSKLKREHEHLLLSMRKETRQELRAK